MIKKLCYLGHKTLREKCKPIPEITPEILRIAEELVQTMRAHNGAGLAAPQIGYPIRMFAIQLSDEIDQDGYGKEGSPQVFLNPNITRFSSDRVRLSEGCLSIPGLHEEVIRPREIDFEATDLQGKKVIEKNLRFWRARCIQHEMDHLDGILFIDRLQKHLKDKHRVELEKIEAKYR